MMKLLKCGLIAATLTAPVQVQAQSREPIPCGKREGGCESDSTGAIVLLGMVAVVIASTQLGMFATRDDGNVMIAPADLDGAAGKDFYENSNN